MWPKCVASLLVVVCVPVACLAQAGGVEGRAATPATAPAADDSAVAIPKGALGPEYVDGSFGFGVRPIAGATVDCRKRTVEGRTQIAQFVRLELGWSMAVRVWPTDRPIDADSARKMMGASLILRYPDITIPKTETIQVAGRPSTRLTAIFSNEGKSWLRQQAVIPLQAGTDILVILTTPADDRTVAEEAFTQILNDFKVLRTRMQQEQLDRALTRGAELIRHIATASRGVTAEVEPLTYLRTTRSGEPIGFVEIEERTATLDRQDGVHTAERAWLFGTDQNVQYVQEDKFVSQDLAYAQWRNFSQIMPSKQADPKQELIVSIEGGIRDHDQLIVEFSNRIGVVPAQDKAIEVDRSYASPSWPQLLPRLIDLKTPELYAFGMYDSGRRGMVLRVFRIVGPKSISIDGRQITANRIEDSEGLVPPVRTIDVDDKGRPLRLASGEIEMTVTSKEQIDLEFGPRVKAAREHFREIANLPPLKSASAAAPSPPPANAGQPPAARPRTRSSASRRPAPKMTKPLKPARKP